MYVVSMIGMSREIYFVYLIAFINKHLKCLFLLFAQQQQQQQEKQESLEPGDERLHYCLERSLSLATVPARTERLRDMLGAQQMPVASKKYLSEEVAVTPQSFPLYTESERTSIMRSPLKTKS